MAKNNYKAAVAKGCNVFYFTSTQDYLVNRAADAVIQELKKDNAEISILEGPKPDIEEMVAAVGTISFFAEKRLVYIKGILPSAIAEKDMKDIADLIDESENAILLFTTVYTDTKVQNGKKNQAFIKICSEKGFYENITEPGEAELAVEMIQRAKSLNTELSRQDAALLVSRCSKNQILLENELDKLAAASGYTTISRDLIAEMTGETLEENAFKMADCIVAGKASAACLICRELLNKKEKAPLIWGAITGNFIDAYRIARALKVAKSTETVGKDFHYTGKFGYRLQKAQGLANSIKVPKLIKVLEILNDVDLSLKSGGSDDLLKMETGIIEITEVLRG